MPPVSTLCNSSTAAAVVATLDLHGFRKEEAIGRLTIFLEEAVRRHCKPTTRRRKSQQGVQGAVVNPREGSHCPILQDAVWVAVITGTGSHSQHGPVLRDAVTALLKKRAMVYHEAKGCFTVNANSGIVLMPPLPPSDTKVIVVENTSGIKPVCTVVAASISPPMLGTIHPSLSSSTSRMASRTISLTGPTPRQVHDDDQLVEHVQQTSMEEFRSLTKKQQQERAQLNRVLSQSQHDEEERRKRLEREEQQAIEQALKKSQQTVVNISTTHSSEEDDEEEQRLLQQAMSESQQEFRQWAEAERTKEELELERVLAQSRYEAYAVLSNEEEAELLQQAISQSMQEVELLSTLETLDFNDMTNNNSYDNNNSVVRDDIIDEGEEQLCRILKPSCQEI